MRSPSPSPNVDSSKKSLSKQRRHGSNHSLHHTTALPEVKERVTTFVLPGFLQMKILEANAGALTNFEVLDFLRAKGASKDPTRVIAKVAQSEYKVYDYLVNTAASDQTRESINEFLTSVKQHDLAKAEVLNIINIRPAAPVGIFPIIENCEDRFPDEEIEEIIEQVKKTWPALPAKTTPEEITEGNEETATLKQEKGNEISQDQNESGEQMDTS